ncbi:LuxR C-terminal-related transcriptional regulator [Devosia sp. XGJD_8]|jgi:DNA-binding CsgD family transcriptional regulator|uniref:LuxR C-terminal-related transcriptional regulator n=1 Tax=Devosia sp. XGJD_8 TaxID=3391187 RepID=UPI003984EE32
MANDPNDEAAILALMHANRIAMWTADFDAWRECFVHADYTTRMGWWRLGGVFVRRGWEELSSRVMRDHPGRRDDYAFDTLIQNVTIRVIGDVAWAVYEQVYPGYDLEGHDGPSLIHEMRVFERHGGQWKIALLGFLDGNAGQPGAAMVRLASDGTVLWVSPAATEALSDSDDLVVRGNRLRFRNSRQDAKFRAALAWAANLDDGLMSRHGALPLVVEAGEGLPMTVYWVAVDAGMIFLSIGTGRIGAKRLALAATIFGLSPAQQQVATLIAEGLSLTDIAERMAIAPNTARTHLRRIFDKTGVHTQPALVRILLSAVAPY